MVIPGDLGFIFPGIAGAKKVFDAIVGCISYLWGDDLGKKPVSSSPHCVLF